MSIESFEAEAEKFYQDTGYLAPGKSESPAALGQLDFDRQEVRRLLKDAWDKGRRREALGQEERDREAEKRGWMKAAGKVEDICAEFGDDPKACLEILGEEFYCPLGWEEGRP